MAGHTPLHPMYVSYSALPPAAAAHNKSSGGNESYYYPTNTGTTAASQRSSSSTTLISPMSIGDHNNLYNSNKVPLPPPQRRAVPRPTDDQIIDGFRHNSYNNNNTNSNNRPTIVDYTVDYSNPIDELRAHQQQPRQDYDTLETHTPNLSINRATNRFANRPLPPVTYSPLLRTRQFNRVANQGSTGRQNRNSYRPRFHGDYIREQQPSPVPAVVQQQQQQQQLPGLRSFYSDPRLAMDEQALNRSPLTRRVRDNNSRGARVVRRDARPMSMFVNNY